MTHSLPPPHVHRPSVQPSVVSESHVRPHPPQLLRSLRVLRQLPAQQSSVPGQTRPQAPQFAIVSRRVQVPLQHCSVPEQALADGPVPQRHWEPMHVVPAGQLTVQPSVHRPAVHVCPAGQAFPQLPQLSALTFVSTQPAAQQVCVPVQAGVHVRAASAVTGPASRDTSPESTRTPVSGSGPVSESGPVSTTAPVSRGNGASKVTMCASGGGGVTDPPSRPPLPPVAHAARLSNDETQKSLKNDTVGDALMGTSLGTR